MILLDASVWIDHIRAPQQGATSLLDGGKVLCHPFVIGEVALGQFRERDLVLPLMYRLPTAELASHPEVMSFIDRYRMFGTGIGYVDAHLLASTLLTPDAKLWTRDKGLKRLAEELNLAASGFQ